MVAAYSAAPTSAAQAINTNGESRRFLGRFVAADSIGEPVDVVSNHFSSLATSKMDCHRSSGSFSRQRSMMWSSEDGVDKLRLDALGTWVVRMAAMISASLRASNAG